MTLISAPAGSGKTVLLWSRIEDAGLTDQVAWVAIDRGERDAQRFWLSVVEQLGAVKAAEGLIAKLAPTPDFEGATLVNRRVPQLGSLERPVVLVIDDLHELHSAEARALLEALLARRPPPLHVVLAGGHDPQLSLHRLRLAEQLTEIGATDLRFTLEETRELPVQSGIALSDQSVSLLHARTEGWMAGLHLAAVALARHPQPGRFVTEFGELEQLLSTVALDGHVAGPTAPPSS